MARPLTPAELAKRHAERIAFLGYRVRQHSASAEKSALQATRLGKRSKGRGDAAALLAATGWQEVATSARAAEIDATDLVKKAKATRLEAQRAAKSLR